MADATRKTPETQPANRGRRAVLKTGALLVPTIVTLHASPAWAATDYTVTAYRYGVNAGLCRNPDYDPNRNDPYRSQKFIECGTNRRNSSGSSELPTDGTERDTAIIQF